MLLSSPCSLHSCMSAWVHGCAPVTTWCASGKEMRKNMEIYKRTGVHPDLAGSQANSVAPLPERDMNRPHVFMDIQLGKESLGEPTHACSHRFTV